MLNFNKSIFSKHKFKKKDCSRPKLPVQLSRIGVQLFRIGCIFLIYNFAKSMAIRSTLWYFQLQHAHVSSKLIALVQPTVPESGLESLLSVHGPSLFNIWLHFTKIFNISLQYFITIHLNILWHSLQYLMTYHDWFNFLRVPIYIESKPWNEPSLPTSELGTHSILSCIVIPLPHPPAFFSNCICIK